MTGEGLADRIAQLRRSVSAHKKAIKEHREQLAIDASELEDTEARFRALGIGLTYASRTGAPQAQE